jgi:hypothetical protein
MKSIVKSIGKNAGTALQIAGGQVAGSYGARFIPIANEKLKAGVLALIGLGISGMKSKVAQNVGLGIASGAITGALKSFGIGGDDTMISAPEVLLQEVEDGPMNGYEEGADAEY